MSEQKKELTQAEPIAYVNVQVGLEEVAAIKVAEVERALLIQQEQLRFDIKKAEAEVPKLEQNLVKAVENDTKASYPEFFEIEKALKGLCKSYSLQISLNNDGKVSVQIQAHGQIAWKGDESKALSKELKAKEEAITKMVDELANAKKKLTMLPHLERTAKAAVAKARLSQTKEGQELLAQIDKISLPALPGPK